MLNSKFLTLLRTLTEKESSAFGKQIKSIHGTTHMAVKAFTYIKKFAPNFEDAKRLELIYAYKKIFPGTTQVSPADKKKLQNTLSDLHTWLKDFLILEKIRSDKLKKELLWMEILKDRGLEDRLRKHTASLKSKLSHSTASRIENQARNIWPHYYAYYALTQMSKSPNAEDLKNCADQLDTFYLMTKLKLSCEIVNLGKLSGFDFDLSILPRLLESYELKKKAVPVPLLILYQQAYILLNDPQEQHYDELHRLLLEFADHLDTDEMHVILSYLHNHAASQIRKGNKSFWKKAHELNKLGLKYELFISKGVMSPTQFNNIINIACKIEAFEWTSDFLKTHQQSLLQQQREPTVAIAEAIIFFAKKEFEQAIDKLMVVKTNDVRQEIRLRALIISCYYESPAKRLLILDFCKNFEAFLRRHHNSKKEMVLATMNFIRVVKALTRQNKSKDYIDELIQASNPIYFNDWLQEKVESYKSI